MASEMLENILLREISDLLPLLAACARVVYLSSVMATTLYTDPGVENRIG